MAKIEYRIDLDNTGKVVITPLIHSLDAGDQLIFTSSSPNAALQWLNGSPFAAPATGDIFPLTQAAAPLQVTRPVDLLKPVAQCGEHDGTGNFTAWQNGPGFPGVDSTTP